MKPIGLKSQSKVMTYVLYGFTKTLDKNVQNTQTTERPQKTSDGSGLFRIEKYL